MIMRWEKRLSLMGESELYFFMEGLLYGVFF